VYLWPDNDEQGLIHMRLIAERLERMGCSVRVMHWDGAPPKGDAADFIALGLSTTDLEALFASALEAATFIEEHERETLTTFGPERPQIVVSNRSLWDIGNDAVQALDDANDPPTLFMRGGGLVRFRRDERSLPLVEPMQEMHVKSRLAACAEWVQEMQRGQRQVSPPSEVAREVLARDELPFPPLLGIVESPGLRADGSLITDDGYDAASQLIYCPPPGFELGAISPSPSDSDISRARECIHDVIADFPFTDTASYANAIGLMLTPFLRPAINGPVPMALINKPQPGTGASLLAETCFAIAMGRGASFMTVPSDEDEMRKRITAALIPCPQIVAFDNVEGTLSSHTLAAVITAGEFSDRLLGRSEIVRMPQRATWIVTSNNIRVAGDLGRRCYLISLDAKRSRPWERSDFRHPGLLKWVLSNRATLIRSLLTVSAAWWAGGQPVPGSSSIGGFEDWSRVVGGVLMVAEIPDFLSNLATVYEQADEESAEWEAFLRQWHGAMGSNAISVASLLEDHLFSSLTAVLPDTIQEALDHKTGDPKKRIGKALSRKRDVRYGNEQYRLAAVPDTHKNTLLWRVCVGTDGS
jgi:hypothetical protein